MRANGSAWCWGGDDVPLGDGTLGTAATPVEVPGGMSWEQVWKGQLRTFALTADGALYQWGMTELGLVPEEAQTQSAVPVPAPALSGGDWTSATSGSRRACGLRDDATAWCWGQNALGQLGDGTSVVPAPSRTK